jgi:predicted O-methyltransferase YrrM
MRHERWAAVDAFFDRLLPGRDAALEGAIRRSRKAGFPDIAVAPNQGRLLELLARATGARRILEVGTLGGYSTIWLARALAPEGRLVSFEIDSDTADVARENIAAAGFADQVEVRTGDAVDLLPQLAAEKIGPFDFSFIDADKENNPVYFEWAVKLSRPGSMILVDNVARGGAVADAASRDSDVLGVRRLADMVANDPRVRATAIQTVGVKGYDGFLLAQVV